MSNEATPGPQSEPDNKGRRLESWKEIAAYLGRDVTTLRRWEKQEGLPVYRLPHGKLGTIYAYTSELDAWRNREAVARATDVPDANADPQPARIRPGRRWLVVGGVVAVGLLVVAYLSTRSSSRRAFHVTEEDTVVIADFANSTGDSVFDGALRQGLSVQLQQSPYLKIVSDQRIRETLRLMGKPEDARMGPEIAKDLCVRVGSKAYIAGSIASIGTSYVIGLQAVNCATGDLLAQEQVQEPGKEEVLDGLSRAASYVTRWENRLAPSRNSILPWRKRLLHHWKPSELLALGATRSQVPTMPPPSARFDARLPMTPISPSPTDLSVPLIPTSEKAISRKRTSRKLLSSEGKSASGKDWTSRQFIIGTLQGISKKHETPTSYWCRPIHAIPVRISTSGMFIMAWGDWRMALQKLAKPFDSTRILH